MFEVSLSKKSVPAPKFCLVEYFYNLDEKTGHILIIFRKNRSNIFGKVKIGRKMIFEKLFWEASRPREACVGHRKRPLGHKLMSQPPPPAPPPLGVIDRSASVLVLYSVRSDEPKSAFQKTFPEQHFCH